MTFRKICSAIVLYTALALGANPVLASSEPPADWVNFLAHDVPVDVPAVSFLDANENSMSLSDFRGKITVVNFWATWCAPCRAEMPSLEKLASELSGETFQVVTIAAGRNPPEMIDVFFERENLSLLTKHRDPRMDLATEMGVIGLPVTVILNEDGKEIARMSGEADWSSDEALAYFRTLIP